MKHFQELRSGGRGVGLNNGLVLLFECSEDFVNKTSVQTSDC